MPTVYNYLIGGVAGLCTVVGLRKHTRRLVLAKESDVSTSSLTGAANNKDLILKLIQVQVFFRHGARTPLNHFEEIDEPIYDKNFLGKPVPHTQIPHKIVNLADGGPQPRSKMDERQTALIFKGGMPAGQLTSLGRHQLFSLGKRIKERYVDDLALVPKDFNTEDVYVRSTNVRRTIKSLECVLAGIYGADNFKEPVIIPVYHVLRERLYPNFSFCSTLANIHSTYHARLKSHPKYSEIMAKINKGLGEEPDHFLEMMKVRDHVVARKAHGLSVPKWLDDYLPIIEQGATIGLQQFVKGDKAHCTMTLSLVAGPLYHMIQKNMDQAITDQNSTQKLHLYSCHDTSVYPLMLVVGKHTDSWPPYGADVRYELYEDSKGGHWVQILFCGKEVIPQGYKQSLLKMEEFQSLVAPYVVTEKQYEEHCSDISVAREFAKYWETAKADTDKDEATVPPIM